MQSLYALEQEAVPDIGIAHKNLSKSVKEAYDLLFFLLSLLVQMAKHVKKEEQLRSSKFLPKKEDIKFSTRFASNPVLVELAKNKVIEKIINQQLTDDEAALIKSLFKRLSESKEYKTYTQSTDLDLSSEKEIVLFLFNKILIKNKLIKQHVEENYPECLNDLGKINQKVNELVENFDKKAGKEIFEQKSIKNEDEFANKLLDKTVENDEQFSSLIAPKLENWDIDRIAVIDMILMKMALSELLYFEQIPIKVSINEYIDISKIYSTPKSKDFVNGILDKIKNELTAVGKIKKVGRGLLE